MHENICTTNTSNYVGKYIMSTSNMNTIVKRMVDPSFWDSLKGFFTGYDDNAVLSIAVYPRDIHTMYNKVYQSRNSGQEMALTNKVKIFNTSTSASGYKVDNNCQNTRFYAGSLVFNGKYNNYLDYAPYTAVEIYLPCVGTVGVDTSRIMNKTVDIYFVIDLETGQITYFLETVDDSGNDINVGQYSGQYGIQLAVNSTNIADNKMNAIMGTITGAVTAMTGNPMGAVQAAGSIMGGFTAPAGVSSSKAGTGIANFYMDSYPYAIITRCKPVEPENYASTIGRPAKLYTSLKNVGGFNIIESIHLTGLDNATAEERSEIESLLKTGVILAGETDRYIDPAEITFTGPVGSDSETITVTMYSMQGNEVQIGSTSALNSAVGDNITTAINGNKVDVKCNFKQATESTGYLRIRDIVNNYVDLRIDFNITAGLAVDTNTYYVIVGKETTMNDSYTGTITAVECDSDTISVDYGAEEITIHYNGTGVVGQATITITGENGQQATIHVNIVNPAFNDTPDFNNSQVKYTADAVNDGDEVEVYVYKYYEGYGSGNIIIQESDSDITDGTGTITAEIEYDSDNNPSVIFTVDGPINEGTATVTLMDTNTGETITKTLIIGEITPLGPITVDEDTYYAVIGTPSTKTDSYTGTIGSVECNTDSLNVTFDKDHIYIEYDGTGDVEDAIITVNGVDAITIKIVHPAFSETPEFDNSQTNYEWDGDAIKYGDEEIEYLYKYYKGYGSGDVDTQSITYTVETGTGDILAVDTIENDTPVTYLRAYGALAVASATITLKDNKTGETITKTWSINKPGPTLSETDIYFHLDTTGETANIELSGARLSSSLLIGSAALSLTLSGSGYAITITVSEACSDISDVVIIINGTNGGLSILTVHFVGDPFEYTTKERTLSKTSSSTTGLKCTIYTPRDGYGSGKVEGAIIKSTFTSKVTITIMEADPSSTSWAVEGDLLLSFSPGNQTGYVIVELTDTILGDTCEVTVTIE